MPTEDPRPFATASSGARRYRATVHPRARTTVVLTASSGSGAPAWSVDLFTDSDYSVDGIGLGAGRGELRVEVVAYGLEDDHETRFVWVFRENGECMSAPPGAPPTIVEFG